MATRFSREKGDRLALSVREAADLLGVGRDAIYNAINRGDLRAVKFGGTLLVPRVELHRILGLTDEQAERLIPRR